MTAERRPHLRKKCPFPGCGWYLVTSWYIGGPARTMPVPVKAQERQVYMHMVREHGHFGPPAKIFT